MAGFKDESGLGTHNIEEIRVITNPTVVRKHGQKSPTTILGAQYSLPFSLAIALFRNITDPAVFNESTVADEEIRSLAGIVELESREMDDGPMASIIIKANGQRSMLEATDWKGAPTNPYSFKEISDKFRTYASGVIDAEKIEETITKVARLEDEPDAAILARLLSPAT